MAGMGKQDEIWEHLLENLLRYKSGWERRDLWGHAIYQTTLLSVSAAHPEACKPGPWQLQRAQPQSYCYPTGSLPSGDPLTLVGTQHPAQTMHTAGTY